MRRAQQNCEFLRSAATATARARAFVWSRPISTALRKSSRWNIADTDLRCGCRWSANSRSRMRWCRPGSRSAPAASQERFSPRSNCSKAQKAGFDWPGWRDLLPKLAEETAELEAEAASGDPARKPAVEAELGDLLFTVVNLGRHLGVDAEMALRGCNLRFRQRFRAMEAASERALEKLSPPELEELWAAAKRRLAAETEAQS